MQKLSIPNYEISDLESLLNSNSDYIVGMRLMALIQIKRGMSSRQLEGLYYKSHSRYCIWVKRFNKFGLEGLRNKPKSGRKSKLSIEQKEKIKSILLENKPEKYGYNSGFWNGPLMIDFIEKQFGIKYKKAQIYNIFKSFGFSYQKSRGFYPEADKEAQENFRKALKKTSRQSQ